jgi:hypothetical protein
MKWRVFITVGEFGKLTGLIRTRELMTGGLKGKCDWFNHYQKGLGAYVACLKG